MVAIGLTVGSPPEAKAQAGWLALVQTPNPTTYSADGATINFDFTVTNNSGVGGSAGQVSNLNFLFTNPVSAISISSLSCTPAASANRNNGQSWSCDGTYTVNRSAHEQSSLAACSNGPGIQLQTIARADSSAGVNTATSGSAQTATICFQDNGGAVEDGNLSITKTVVGGLTTYDDTTGQIEYLITITHTGAVSSAAVTQIVVKDFLNGVESTITDDCNWPAGTGVLNSAQDQATCSVTYIIQPGDLVVGAKIENFATASGKSQGNPVNAQSATVTVYFAVTEEMVVSEVSNTVKSFVGRRMGMIMSEQPDSNRLVRRRGGGIGAGVGGGQQQAMNVTGAGGQEGGAQVAMSTSLQQMMAARAYVHQNRAEATIRPAADLPRLPDARAPEAYIPPVTHYQSRWDIWIEARYAGYRDRLAGFRRDGHFGIAYLGVDYLVNDALVIGVMGQFDWGREKSGALGTRVKGHGWMIGPYLSAEVIENVFFDVRAAWGQSDNDVRQTILGTAYKGDFDTDRWLVRGALTGNYHFDEWRVSPTIAVAYMEEKVKGYSVDDGIGNVVAIPGETLRLGQLSVGPEVARPFHHDGHIIEPFAALRLIWDFKGTGSVVFDGNAGRFNEVRGQAEAGLIWRSQDGIAARISGSYEGIGASRFDAYSVRGWLSIPF